MVPTKQPMINAVSVLQYLLDSKRELSRTDFKDYMYKEYGHLGSARIASFLDRMIRRGYICRSYRAGIQTVELPPEVTQALAETGWIERKKFSHLMSQIRSELSPGHRDQLTYLYCASHALKRYVTLLEPGITYIYRQTALAAARTEAAIRKAQREQEPMATKKVRKARVQKVLDYEIDGFEHPLQHKIVKAEAGQLPTAEVLAANRLW